MPKPDNNKRRMILSFGVCCYLFTSLGVPLNDRGDHPGRVRGHEIVLPVLPGERSGSRQ